MKKITLLIILLTSYLLFALSCTKPPQQALNIGTNVWIGYEPFYLARNIGLISEKKIKLVEYSSSVEVIRAFRNRSLDFAALTLDEALLLLKDNFDLKLVLVIDESAGADALISQPYIHNISELRGKKIGVENTVLGGYFLSLILKNVGLTENDIKTVYVEAGQHISAIKNKEVDAVVTFSPILNKIKKLGGRVLFDSRRIPDKIFDVLVTTDDILNKRPEDVREIIQLWGKSLKYLSTNKNKSIKFISERESLPASAIQESLDQIRFKRLQDNKTLLTGQVPLKETAKELAKIIFKKNKTAADTAINFNKFFSVPDTWYETEEAEK